MNSNSAINWLETEAFNQWMLFRGDDEKVSSYDSDNESVEEGVERFKKIIVLQQPGKYLLKAYKGKSKQAAAMAFRFDIKQESSAPANRTMSQQHNIDPQALFDKAKDAAYREFMADMWREKVDEKLAALRKDLTDLAQAFKDLNDDEEDNDETALDRISDVAEKLPNLMNGLQSMSGFLSKR